jgi:hypothetical protein
MDLANVRAKLGEAEFFLAKMCRQEPRFIGDKRPFDYYLSAFLNAARTVDYRLRHERGAIYKLWRAAWNAQLATGENRLLKFMADDRAYDAQTIVEDSLAQGRIPVIDINPRADKDRKAEILAERARRAVVNIPDRDDEL